MAQKKITKYETVLGVQLEKYRGPQSRHICPYCKNRKKSFTYYVFVDTGEKVGEGIGKCGRVESCTYHRPPTGDDFKNKSMHIASNKALPEYRESDISNIIDSKYVIKSQNLEDCNFAQFLLNTFKDALLVKEVLKNYCVGTKYHWAKKATIFWQIDKDWNVRTGKIMGYDKETGKRIKKDFNHVSWVHSMYGSDAYGLTPDYHLQQCFFGEHLLNKFHENVPVNFVESEKTAILCTIKNPTKFFVATGGVNLINSTRMEPFKGRKLIFYPDKGKAFTDWTKKLESFKGDYDITVSNYLEKHEDIKKGEDLADLILKQIKYKKDESI